MTAMAKDIVDEILSWHPNRKFSRRMIEKLWEAYKDEWRPMMSVHEVLDRCRTGGSCGLGGPPRRSRDDVFGRLDWQADCERRPLAFDAFDLDRATMHFHQLHRQMEPDAGSRDPGRSAGAEKPFEEPWKIRSWFERGLQS